MKPPEGLSKPGIDAWHTALDACSVEPVPVERYAEAIDRYARAVDMAFELREEWMKLGRPTLEKGGTTGKVIVMHPVVSAIAEAERNAARFGAHLGLDPQSRKKLGAAVGRPQSRVPARNPNREPEPPKLVPFDDRRGQR